MLKLTMLKHILTGAALCGFAMGATADVRAVPRHVFSMSCKVTSCNSELATPAGRERAIGWFRTNHITKLWLESYRHTESVPTERLIEERDAFRNAGFTVCGMITPTQLNAPGADGKRPMVVCWSDSEARARLRAEAVRAAGVFDTVILDDFLFSHCDDSCARCKADKARRGIADWGAYRRALLYEVCERDILAPVRAANPKAHFIIKYPCWYKCHAQNGYDVVRQTKLFGECWIGTETRDANPQPLQACWIMDRFDRLTEGRCGGGWYDGLDSSPEKFVEQAYYTILGGARESLVHCYDYLVADDPGVTPFGEKATRAHACAAAFTREIDRLQKLGDFLCGAERLGYVRGADGVSRHRFRKDGRTYLARLNTTDKAADGLPPHGFDFRDEAKVPMSLHPIFQDGLTFAANRPIRIYGSGAGRVEVEFCGKKSEGRPTADGWLAELPSVPVGGPHVLRVTLNGTVREIRDVTVGEVWLMAGQSNMKAKLGKKPFEPVGGVRVYSASSVERGERFVPKDGWVAVTKESASEFSALACHFGRERRTKGVENVGLVSCAQGASVIESWVPASVTRTPAFNLAPGDLHGDHANAPYLDWNAPGGLYEFGFRTLGPFSFTGVVWYQGESDTTEAEAAVYPALLKELVGTWRKDLRDDALPFYVVQIADFDHRKDAGWRNLQNAQAKASAQIPGVTLVRSADVCATDDIHPSGKDRLAKRLSNLVREMGN